MKKKKDTFSCKRANEGDIGIFFRWANDSKVRKSAFKTNKISWSTHKNWYYKKIKSKKVLIFIIKKNRASIGQARFEKEKNFISVDYSLDRKFRGLGLGKKILSMAIKKIKKTKKNNLIGKVKKNNIRSVKVFKSLGFKGIIKNKIYYFKKIYN